MEKNKSKTERKVCGCRDSLGKDITLRMNGSGKIRRNLPFPAVNFMPPFHADLVANIMRVHLTLEAKMHNSSTMQSL